MNPAPSLYRWVPALAVLALLVFAAVLGDARQTVHGSQGPDQATATPTQCPKWYQIRVHAFPDDIGITEPYIGVPGCDGYYTPADRMEAAYTPLGELTVTIFEAGHPEKILGEAMLKPEQDRVDAVHVFAVCAPPPLEVQLGTPKSMTRRLCPNFSSARLLEQRDFDRSFGGNYVSEVFPFRLCRGCPALSMPYVAAPPQ